MQLRSNDSVTPHIQDSGNTKSDSRVKPRQAPTFIEFEEQIATRSANKILVAKVFSIHSHLQIVYRVFVCLQSVNQSSRSKSLDKSGMNDMIDLGSEAQNGLTHNAWASLFLLRVHQSWLGSILLAGTR